MPYTTESQPLTTADLAETATGSDRYETDQPQQAGPLFPRDISQEMQTNWESIQAAFVDDPQVSVRRADELVATAIKKLAETFAEERAKMEQQWSKGNDVSTEDLRQALRRYRAFFHRLLSM